MGRCYVIKQNSDEMELWHQITDSWMPISALEGYAVGSTTMSARLRRLERAGYITISGDHVRRWAYRGPKFTKVSVASTSSVHAPVLVVGSGYCPVLGTTENHYVALAIPGNAAADVVRYSAHTSPNKLKSMLEAARSLRTRHGVSDIYLRDSFGREDFWLTNPSRKWEQTSVHEHRQLTDAELGFALVYETNHEWTAHARSGGMFHFEGGQVIAPVY